MGLIRGSFILSNPTRPDLAPLEASALADSRAVHLCIPGHLAIQLSLAELERREVVLADGHRRTVPYVGPVGVRFRNRRCFTGAMVLGNEVLLGSIPMEEHGPCAASPASERGCESGEPQHSAQSCQVGAAARACRASGVFPGARSPAAAWSDPVCAAELHGATGADRA
jgi:clan AA aspartic protease